MFAERWGDLVDAEFQQPRPSAIRASVTGIARAWRNDLATRVHILAGLEVVATDA
jgi:hypothetical protein